MNIYDIICQDVGNYSGKAVVCNNKTLSYKELFEEVKKEADNLINFGVTPQSKVAIILGNNLESLIRSLAILKINAILIPISRHAKINEVEKIVYQVSPEFFYTFDTLKKLNPITLSKIELPNNRKPCFIRFSSGTTGKSKGVILSHDAVYERTNNCHINLSEGDKVLWVLDMAFHFVVTIITFLRRKGEIHLCGDQGDGIEMLKIMKEYPINLLYCTPYYYRLMIGNNAFTKELFTHIKEAISTAINLTALDAHNFQKRFNKPLFQAYGIIEVGLPAINKNPELLSSVGEVLPPYKVKLCNDEICFKGPGMFDAYLTPFKLKEELFPDGFFHTGDLGKVEGNNLFITGRCKEVINFMGMKIFPTEVEAVINEFPGVKESRVLGKNVPEIGEIPVAEIRVMENQSFSTIFIQELRQYLFKVLPAWQIPKEFIEVEAIAKTSSGKIVRS